MGVRGFLLQPTYRLRAGRPMVHLYGRLEAGETFLVRDNREVPHFYILARDAQRAPPGPGAALVPTDKLTLGDEPVVRVEIPTPSSVPPLRESFTKAGIPCFEADVRFAMRYLIDRQIRGCLEIRGTSQPGTNLDAVDRVFDNPEVLPAAFAPRLSVLSFDIETDPGARRLLAISLYGCGAEEVLLLTPKGFSCPPGAIAARSEAELLRRFVRRVRELDPDVLTGWNVVDFDLAVLERVAERCGVPLALGRGAGRLNLRLSESRRGASRASVVGRVVLDGLQLLWGSFVRLERYSLDFVARQVLGKGKTIQGQERAGEILRTFHNDRPRFVDYALNDARLVLEILQKLRLVELAVERSRLTGMPPDRVSSSIAAFDFLYLAELGKRRRVAPTVGSQETAPAPTSGGYVLSPRPGLYENVLVFDFKSLYPSVIRTFQIDPLGYLPHADEDAIVAPNNAAFRRSTGILTSILDELFPRREAAKEEGNQVASHAIKILMNSFYGVLGTSACRFHNPALANAITGFGREILLWSKGQIEQRGLSVLYGDTDSLFVDSDLKDPQAAYRRGQELLDHLNAKLTQHVWQTWQVESRLELELETLYLRLLLPSMRHGGGGARKRYVGLVEENGVRRVTFTGMEVVRRDWTELAKQAQRELYERLFSDRPLEKYLENLVRDLRQGRLDSLLVYRKALGKDLDAYTATTPPHVVAARKMTRPPGRLISYLMTTAGPEPLEETDEAEETGELGAPAEVREQSETKRLVSPLDYEHYVDKQIRPVAEPVLSLLGLDFARVIGDETQMELFEPDSPADVPGG